MPATSASVTNVPPAPTSAADRAGDREHLAGDRRGDLRTGELVLGLGEGHLGLVTRCCALRIGVAAPLAGAGWRSREAAGRRGRRAGARRLARGGCADRRRRGRGGWPLGDADGVGDGVAVVEGDGVALAPTASATGTTCAAAAETRRAVPLSAAASASSSASSRLVERLLRVVDLLLRVGGVDLGEHLAGLDLIAGAHVDHGHGAVGGEAERAGLRRLQRSGRRDRGGHLTPVDPRGAGPRPSGAGSPPLNAYAARRR